LVCNYCKTISFFRIIVNLFLGSEFLQTYRLVQNSCKSIAWFSIRVNQSLSSEFL